MSTTDGWLKLNFASCVVRKTRSLALVLCSICNMVFVNYIYDMIVDTQFHKFHGRPLKIERTLKTTRSHSRTITNPFSTANHLGGKLLGISVGYFCSSIRVKLNERYQVEAAQRWFSFYILRSI